MSTQAPVLAGAAILGPVVQATAGQATSPTGVWASATAPTPIQQ